LIEDICLPSIPEALPSAVGATECFWVA